MKAAASLFFFCARPALDLTAVLDGGASNFTCGLGFAAVLITGAGFAIVAALTD